MKQKDKGTRSIKFYLDESVNNVKKEKILRFLRECQIVENKLLTYYWDNKNFYNIINCHNNLDFNRIMINYRNVKPQLKSHHFQQIAQKVFQNLKSIQSNIVNHKVYFRFKDDKIKQRIYNYCIGFCFNWNDMQKYINKQLKIYKKKDVSYYEFLLKINNYIENEKLFNQLKNDIENKFWECKEKYKLPQKKEFQILCNTLHTVDIQIKEFQWVFTIDNNDRIGGSERKGVFDTIVIPVKFSNYHKKLLKDKKLANTFNLKLNKYNKIEIIGCYDINIKPVTKNEIKDTIGIDIGLKKLITSSDGEIVEQDKNILHKLSKVIKRQANRQTLEKHLKKIYNNDNFKLSDKRYLLQQTKLSDYVKCENRHLIKNFLSSRLNDHIIIENLELAYVSTKSKKVNYLMKRLGIQGIKRDLIKYAKDFGISISPINPAYTSQQCPICGHISRENRKTQEKFCCVNCNHTDNADHNASINIMNRYGDKRITLDMPTWRVKEILEIN